MPDQPTAEELADTAERAWRWVLDQVRTDEVGPWIPEQVTGSAADETLPNHRDGMDSGIADPRLPTGVGWMQEAAGIAAFLFDAGRAARDGAEAAAVPRMESSWALEAAS